MVPIYRDWDHDINEGHSPKMVYATYLNEGVEKDIILHKRRKTYITCILGEVEVTSISKDEISKEILSFNDEGCINLLLAEPGTPLRFKNLSKGVSILINCPDPSWHPQNTDTYKYKDWKEIKNV